MKNVFVETENVQAFRTMMDTARGVRLGQPGIFVVTGRAGRGKTETCKWYCAQHEDVVYVSYIGIWTPLSMLQDICWELAQYRPSRSKAAFEVIRESMEEERKVIVIDEADRMTIKMLDLVRDLNNQIGCSIVFVGEEPLTAKLSKSRRLCSRIRQRLAFAPVSQADIAQFYRMALGVEVEPEALVLLAKACEGDFRPALVDAYAAEVILRNNKLSVITKQVAELAISQRLGGKNGKK